MLLVKKHTLFRSNIIISLLSFVNISFNFSANVLIASLFGASEERDIYFTAIVIPTYLSTLYIGSIVYLVLPTLSKYKVSNPATYKRIFSNVFNLSTVSMLCLSILLFYFSEQVISLTAPGFTDDEIIIAADLVKILSFSIPFQCLFNLCTILYHLDKEFIRTSIAPIGAVAINVVCIILTQRFLGIAAVALGYIVGTVFTLVIVVPKTIVYYKGKVFFEAYDPEVRKLLKASLPLLLSGILFRSTTIIERLFASTLPEGSISYLGYSNQLMMVMATVISTGIATTFFPLMAEAWSNSNKSMLSAYANKAIAIIVLLSAPIMLIVVLVGESIINLIFVRGAFSIQDAAAVSNSFKILMGALFFTSLGNIISKIYYLTNETRAIAVIATIELIAYIVFSYFFSDYFSYLGLAVALTVSTGINIVLSIIYIQWKYSLIQFPSLLKLLSEICLTAGISISLYYSFDSLFNPSFNNYFKLFIYILLILAPFIILILNKYNPTLLHAVVTRAWKKLN